MTQTALFLLKILQCSTMAHSASRSYTSAHNKINARASPARARLNLPLRTSARAIVTFHERMRAARFRSLQICIPRYLSTLAFVCHLLRDRFDSVLHGGGGGRPTQFPLVVVVAAVHLMSECSRCVETRRRIKINKCSWTTKVNRKSVPGRDSFIRLIYIVLCVCDRGILHVTFHLA
jgi:hypothetical protein